MLLSLWNLKTGLLFPIILKVGIADGNNNVDGIAMVDGVGRGGGNSGR